MAPPVRYFLPFGTVRVASVCKHLPAPVGPDPHVFSALVQHMLRLHKERATAAVRSAISNLQNGQLLDSGLCKTSIVCSGPLAM